MFPSAPKKCPAACTKSATLELSDVDMFSKQIMSLKHILR